MTVYLSFVLLIIKCIQEIFFTELPLSYKIVYNKRSLDAGIFFLISIFYAIALVFLIFFLKKKIEENKLFVLSLLCLLLSTFLKINFFFPSS